MKAGRGGEAIVGGELIGVDDGEEWVVGGQNARVRPQAEQ